MIAGVKRCIVSMMFVAVPLVSAGPIFMFQQISPVPAIAPRTKALQSVYRKSLRIPKEKTAKQVSYGIASWYSQSDPGINRRTANGEIFDDTKRTCAAWQFPFGTRLRITNVANGRSVICTVNDRGPAKRLNRLIDLSKGAFQEIAETRKGLIRVCVTKL